MSVPNGNSLWNLSRIIVWSALFILVSFGCEEELPPRVDPRMINANEVLRLDVSPFSGTVIFDAPDSTPSALAGTFFLGVTNLHDEFLSAPEDIFIQLDFWPLERPTSVFTVLGDRNNLINPYDFQGHVFMLDGDILSLSPDSTANLVISVDHLNHKLWEFGNPEFMRLPCQFPPCDAWVETDSIELMANVSIRMFRQQHNPLVVEAIRFSVAYTFLIGSAASVEFDSIGATVESLSSEVIIGWKTTEELYILGFEVQKAFGLNSDYFTIPDSFLPGTGGMDTVSRYVYRDTLALRGQWFYRLAVVEDLWLVGPLQVAYSDPVPVLVP
jgi:hypothetical protein